MANRQEVLQKRARLSSELRAACRNGQWAPGALVPSQAELSKTYGLSAAVVHEELRKLIDDGVMYAVPRVGTFVGTPRSENVEVYLLILPWLIEARNYGRQIQMGFEERIAQLGGVSLMLSAKEAGSLWLRGGMPPLKGVFEVEPTMRESFEQAGIPYAYFGNIAEAHYGDSVHFDDVNGGAQATRHLLASGHRRIAFLGLHTHENENGAMQWSAEREIGWSRAMKEAGEKTDLIFRAPGTPEANPVSQQEMACRAARELVHRNDIQAVVATNFPAVDGLLEALRTEGIPAENWPAIIGFDEPLMSGAIVSYFRLPWEQIGRDGAEMLHHRANGKMPEARQQRLVSMRLIPRFSCRGQWTSIPGLTEPLTTSQIPIHATVPINSGRLIEA